MKDTTTFWAINFIIGFFAVALAAAMMWGVWASVFVAGAIMMYVALKK